MSQYDIKIKQLFKSDFSNGKLEQSKLVLDISGDSINSSIINTFRRIAYDFIPTYAFDDNNIFIDNNTSIFNNDYMKLRLSQITVPKIDFDVDYLEDKYWKNIDYANPNRIKHPKDTQVIELYINYKNNTNDVYHVNTNDSKIYINGKVEKKFDEEFPHLLISLRPNQEFNCRCVASLGIGKLNNIWSSVSNCFYEEIDQNHFILTLLSQGQLDEYDILYRSCTILKKKLDEIGLIIKDNYDKAENRSSTDLKIIFKDTDHTVGNILNDFIQDHKDVIFSGMNKSDLLIDSITIFFRSKKDPIQTLYDVIDEIQRLFDWFQKYFSQVLKK